MLPPGLKTATLYFGVSFSRQGGTINTLPSELGVTFPDIGGMAEDGIIR